MTSDSVSVVIPAHNAGNFLAEAVASIRAQTAGTLEIIVVDDGSTDRTTAVMKDLGATIRAVHQERAGAAAARNRGAAMAAGEWLAFLDADDLWAPGKLALQLAWLRDHAETDVAFGHGCNFTIGADGQRRQDAARPAFVPGAALMRRDFFLRHAQFTVDVISSEVIDWNLRLRRDGVKMHVLPKTVLYRRLHETNVRRTGDRGRAADLRLLREWVRTKRS